MRKLFLFLAITVCAFANQTITDTRSGTHNDISWTLSETGLTTGQFADGSWYVVSSGSVHIIAISPASVVGNGVANQIGDGKTYSSGRTINGTMTNPVAGGGASQGFDSLSTTFLSSLNAGRPGGSDLSSGNPLVVAPGTSVVSTYSDSAAPGGNKWTSLDAAVLTVLSSAPPSGSFRPPYCGTTKTLWNISSLDYSILKSYAPVTGTPTLATCQGYFVRPWIEVVTDFQGAEIHPINNQPFYGRDLAYELGDGLLRLQLNDSNSAKQQLYIEMVQIGIDFYGAALSGAGWQPDGGHNHGRKMPVILAGLALNDTNIKAYCNPTSHLIFAEDMCYFTVDSTEEAQAIDHTDYDYKYRTDYLVRSSTVTISNSSPAVVTWPMTPTTVTISNSSPAVITWPSHGLYVGQLVQFSSTVTLPAGITAGVDYFVQPDGIDANHFKISLNMNALYFNGIHGTSYTLINTSSAGSGTFSGLKGHGFGATQQIVFSNSGGLLPTGITAGTKYWTRWTGLTTNQFTISAAPSNENDGWGTGSDKPAINTTTAGSGTQTATFDMTGQVDYGIKHTVSNQYDGSNWNSAYRTLVDGPVFAAILAARMTTGAQTLWNYSPPFTYMDGPYTGGDTFANAMYAAYRAGLSGSDTTPPTPNPSTIASTSHTSTTISVTATTATDASSPPVQYWFSSNGGSTWSAWQSSPSYTFTGLTPSTTYSIVVQARDSASTPNNATQSSPTSVTTDAGGGGGSPPANNYAPPSGRLLANGI